MNTHYYNQGDVCTGETALGCEERKENTNCKTYNFYADKCETCQDGQGKEGGNETVDGTCPNNCISTNCEEGWYRDSSGCGTKWVCKKGTIEKCKTYIQNGTTLNKCETCEDGYGDAQNKPEDNVCNKYTPDPENCKQSCDTLEYQDTNNTECHGTKYCVERNVSSHCKKYSATSDRCEECDTSYYRLNMGVCIPNASSTYVECMTSSTKCLSSTGSYGKNNYFAVLKTNSSSYSAYGCTPTGGEDVVCVRRIVSNIGSCADLSPYYDKCLKCQPNYGVGSNNDTPVYGKCRGDLGADPDWFTTSSAKVVEVHEVSEGMTKRGITKFVAKSNTLENFNDEITEHNGKTDGITQKIAVSGKFNNAVDITGAVNVHNGSEDGGIGNIEIFDDGTAENVKGAVKGLVGGNNYEGSAVSINLDVKDGVQNGKRSFIAGMGKEVGAYQSDNKEELDGIDLGSAAYGQHNRTLTNAGDVSINSEGDAPVFGMLGLRHADNVEKHSENQNLGDFENAETGVINVNAPNAAEAYGIKVNNLINKDGLGTAYSNIVNDGTINVSGGSNVYGISAKNASVYNNGDINVSATGDNAYGIYADKSKVENTGNINIDAPKAGNAYGIYAANGSTVKNEGTITINNDKSTDNVADGKFIYTDKSSYVLNSGTIFSDASLNTSSLGGTNLLMSTGANITAPEVSGTLNLSSDVTTGSNANVYVMQNLVNGSTANLDVLSQSAMFSAALNDYGSTADAVLTRNSFNSLMSNSSLADYLERNYASGKGTELFDELKKQTSLEDLNEGIGDFFGQRLPKMTFEDMSIMRELNFDMSKNMFNQEGAFEYGGNVAPYGYSDTVNSTGRYALYGFNYGKKSYGFGVAISDVNSYDEEKADNRKDTGVVVSTPIARKVNGFEFITTPQLGYAYGEYTRAGFNNSYNGKVYKRMYALMNEVRYPMSFGKLRFTPVAEFNMIGFNVKGSEEAHKQFNLRIPSQTHYSVEAGLGFMIEKAFSLYKLHNFKFNTGLAFYHEFANPYELDIRMSELEGTYRLHDEKRHNNRVAARFGFDYELLNNIDVSMSVLSNIDGECRTDAVCDIKYHF